MRKLEGSCHCGAVRFSVMSHAPYPYMRCYCSICRKTSGSGGFSINLGADARTLEVEGEDNMSVYQARLPNDERSPARRHFCKICGSPLWIYDPRWPELLHPQAGAIDTALPKPSAFVDLMLGSAAPWVALHDEANVDRFDGYPELSVEDWHRQHGLWED